MKIVKRVVLLLTVLLGVVFTSAALYKIKYYRVFYRGIIDFRAIHIVMLFALLLLIGIILYVRIKSKRRIISIVLITLSVLYAWAMMLLVREYQDYVSASEGIANDYQINGYINPNVTKCKLEGNKIKITLKKPSTMTDSYLTHFILVVDDDYKNNEFYEDVEVLSPEKGNVAYVDCERCVKTGKKLLKAKAYHHLDMYYSIDDRLFLLKTKYKKNLMNQLYAIGDSKEIYNAININILYFVWIFTLIGLMLLETNKPDFEDKTIEYKMKRDRKE